MNTPIVDPNKVSVLVAGGLGAFLSVLFQRSSDKATIFTTLVTAEVASYYLAHPFWVLLHARFVWADEQWEGPVALTLGLLAIFVIGGITKMFSDFYGSPWKGMGKLAVWILERFVPLKRKGD